MNYYSLNTLDDVVAIFPPEKQPPKTASFDVQAVGTINKSWFWRNATLPQLSILKLLWCTKTFRALIPPGFCASNMPQSSLNWKQTRQLLDQGYMAVWRALILSSVSLFTVAKKNGFLRPICNPSPLNKAISSYNKVTQ